MIPLECYASIPLLFLYNFLPNFLYAFIGISLEIVGGQMRSIRYSVMGMVLLWCCGWCGLIVRRDSNP